MLVLVNACTGSDRAMIELTWLCCKGSFRFTFLIFRRRRGVGLGPQSPDSPDCGVGGRVGVGGGCATEATRGGGGGATGGGGKDEPLTPPHTPSEEERLRPNPVISKLFRQFDTLMRILVIFKVTFLTAVEHFLNCRRLV